MEDEKYIKQLFEGIEIDHELDLEYKIMDKIEKQQDHSVLIKRYKLVSKIGLIASSLLAIIISYIYILPIFSKGFIVPNNQTETVMPFIYSITTLLAIYIQIELYSSKNKKGSQI